jgi:hypothetical protein
VVERVLARNPAVASPNVFKKPNDDVVVSVSVSDDEIRKQGVTHDGYEKAFAMLQGSDGQWHRYELQYTGSWANRGGGGVRDNYSLVIPGNEVSLDGLRKDGVAFGLEVSGPNGQDGATVWLQNFADNYKP